jgi:acetyl esterase/lipase
VEDAVAWTRAHMAEYGAGDSLFIMGHSAGGHLATLHAVQNPGDAQGYMILSGIWDVPHMIASSSAQFNEETSYPLFGRDPEIQNKYSPEKAIRHINAPVMIAVGAHDYDYLKAQAQSARDLFEALRKPYEYLVVPGYIHEEMVVKFGRAHDVLLSRIVEFVHKYSQAP